MSFCGGVANFFGVIPETAKRLSGIDNPGGRYSTEAGVMDSGFAPDGASRNDRVKFWKWK